MALSATAGDVLPSPKDRGATPPSSPHLRSGRGAHAGGEGASVSSARQPTTDDQPSDHSPLTTIHPLTVTALPATRRDQAARIWAGLLHQSGIDELTTSWTWVATWLDAYGDAVPHRFLVATDAAGAPVAIALATRGRAQRRGPLPVRTAHLGTAGEGDLGGVYVEYNRLLALPGHRAAALRAFADQLAGPRWRVWGQVDVVELNGFAPEELDGWDARGFTRDTHACRVVDLAALRASATPLDKAFGGQIGRKLRKNARWFTERYGPIATEWITDPARGQEAFTELVELHQARWVAAGKPGAFSSRRLIRFHRAMIDALLPVGRVALVRVTAGEQLVGVSYSFHEHGALNHYQWGLMEPGPDENSLSPGFVTALALLSEGLDRGFREVNWLGGDARWKRELSTTTRDLVWAERPVSPWAHAVRAAISLKRRLRPVGAILTTTGRSSVARALRSPLPSGRGVHAGGEGASGNRQPETGNSSSPSTPDPSPSTRPEVHR